MILEQICVNVVCAECKKPLGMVLSPPPKKNRRGEWEVHVEPCESCCDRPAAPVDGECPGGTMRLGEFPTVTLEYDERIHCKACGAMKSQCRCKEG